MTLVEAIRIVKSRYGSDATVRMTRSNGSHVATVSVLAGCTSRLPNTVRVGHGPSESTALLRALYLLP